MKIGRFAVVKLPAKICGAIGTKHLDASTMRNHSERMNVHLIDVTHETALKAKV